MINIRSLTSDHNDFRSGLLTKETALGIVCVAIFDRYFRCVDVFFVSPLVAGDAKRGSNYTSGELKIDTSQAGISSCAIKDVFVDWDAGCAAYRNDAKPMNGNISISKISPAIVFVAAIVLAKWFRTNIGNLADGGNDTLCFGGQGISFSRLGQVEHDCKYQKNHSHNEHSYSCLIVVFICYFDSWLCSILSLDNFFKSEHRNGVAAKSAHGFDIPLYRRRSQAALNSARLFYGWAGSGIVRSAVPTDGMSTLFAWPPLFDIYGSGNNANRRRIA